MGMKHYLVGSCLALSLAIAACQPAGNGTDMPGTDDMVGTDTFGTATSSGSGSGDLLTETPMGTDVMTGTVTADATETEPMMTATAAMTGPCVTGPLCAAMPSRVSAAPSAGR